MKYCSISDLQTHFSADQLIRLSDRSNGQNLDTAKINQAIDFASRQIDQYLAGFVVTPLQGCGVDINGTPNPMPPFIVEICCDIAIYNMFNWQTPDKAIKERYENAIKRLMMLKKGDVSHSVLLCPLNPLISAGVSAMSNEEPYYSGVSYYKEDFSRPVRCCNGY